MDHLQRLILWALLAFFSAPAFAVAVPPSTPDVYSMARPGGGTTITASTAAGVCSQYVTALLAQSNAYAASTGSGDVWTGNVTSATATLCSYHLTQTNSAGYVTANLDQTATITKSVGPLQCPSNSTGDASPPTSCTCAPGYVAGTDGLSCAPPPPPTCKQRSLPDVVLGPFTSKGNVGTGYTSCEAVPGGGCLHSYSRFMTSEAPDAWYGTYHEKATGANCTPGPGGLTSDPGGAAPPSGASGPSGGGADAPASTPPATPCKSGTCSGTVNGAQVCVACNSTSTDGPSTVAGPTTTASSPAGAVPGTSTTTGGTTCAAGVCTTTTTTTTNGPGGNTTTGTTTTTTGQGAFCAANPGDPNCAGEGSSFTGSCSAAKCEGDAIQCQIAKEQAVRNCQTLDPAPADDPAVVAATKGIHPSDHPWNTPDEHSLASGFDKSNLIGGACPADQVVQVSHFRPVTLPFSSLCGPAGMLGNVLVGITALCCLGIVFVRGK